MEQDYSVGLMSKKSEWPTMKRKDIEGKPIEILKPDSDAHARVLNYLMARFDYSATQMEKFYSRWNVNEKKLQAYISLNDYEKQLKEMNDASKAPKVVSVIIPYNFATVNTIVTYLLQTFTGRRPIFQVSTNKSAYTQSARNMENVIQYNADHTRLVKQIHQWVYDSQVYGIGVLRCDFMSKKAMRTVFKQNKILGMIPGAMERSREMRTVYEGNMVKAIDPYMFFPDPRVPMSEVNRRGEFVFWKSYEGKHILKQMEASGAVKWVDAACKKIRNTGNGASLERDRSERAIRSEGESTAGADRGSSDKNTALNQDTYEIIQGTVNIVPAELGLGSSEKIETWIFSISNRDQIIQAEPYLADHNMHPISVTEPDSMGYAFGSCAIVDYLNPIQDMLSWFINSHMDNVKTSLNNMWIVDPSKVEIQDIKNPGAGKIIRLKQTAFGSDINAAIKQLPVSDVTGSHMRDFNLMMNTADALASVNDNLRGIQDSGGRKTATEVRTSSEAGASRLAAKAKIMSAQCLVDVAEQMAMNNQQYLSDEFYIEMLGEDAMKAPIKIGPQHLVGDFHYPINDGTLPIDRVAMVDVWKQIFQGVAADPELRKGFNVMEIFKYLADLGGAKNIDRFMIQAQSPEALAQQAQAGNVVPLQDMRREMGGMLPPPESSPTPGIPPNPADRMFTNVTAE